MIEEIEINNAATFKHEIINPKKVNYFYGFNGSGKSTLAKIIENPLVFGNCLRKFTNEEIEVLAYNQAFVDNNFYETSNIKGIFTLGKDATEVQKIIEDTKAELDKKSRELNCLKLKVDEKYREKQVEEKKFQDKCWEVKIKYGERFKEVLIGKIGSKSLFASNCLSINIDKNSLFSIHDLEVKYDEIYKSELTPKELLQSIFFDDFCELEFDRIFNEEIKGNDSLSVSELIEKLNNSDWVKNGIKYLEIDNNHCPFCQQSLVDININELLNYFDREYENKCEYIKNLFQNYDLKYQNLFHILEQDIDKMNEESKCSFSSKIKEFSTIVENNRYYISKKIETPSTPIILNSTRVILEEILEIINIENDKIINFNKMVDNAKQAKVNLNNSVWNYFANELESHINIYNKCTRNIEKAITAMNEKIDNLVEQIKMDTELIKQKESEITGITQTIIEINKILESFGFTGFRLEESEIKGRYKIVRSDGSNVGKTLSEGEYRFITFLYFYQLIKGSNEQSGIVKDRIIVIDDPISSLDSNTIFIVSTLVKNIIKNCLEEIDGIKQLFVLTHNIYFYKEIIYKGSGKHKKETKEQYHIIKKIDNTSSIQVYEENPIETTYQLLWDELKPTAKKNRATVYNTMRRILEYYFNIIGNKNYEECINKFYGEDRILCKALISFINDNSHYISDDFSMIFDDDTIEKYQRIFKQIFKNLGHISHYNMMMGIDDELGDCMDIDINQAIEAEMRDDKISIL